MKRTIYKSVVVLLSMVSLTPFLSAQSLKKQKPLVIEQQGSFAVGGTVITNPGTFDPYKPTPEGQTFHGDHAYVFLKSATACSPSHICRAISRTSG